MGSLADFVLFELIEEKAKTKVWAVEASSSYTNLGQVKWHCAWRRYAFFPAYGTLFEQVCLREIAMFLELETEGRKAERKAERKQELSSD